MAKRKRNTAGESRDATNGVSANKKVKPAESSPVSIQIVAGSYDRVLHGITATISTQSTVEFADTFLFNAHTSAIRCLALSPPSAHVPGQSQKIILASGSTDERINLYHLSAHIPRKRKVPLPSLTSKIIVQNPQNRELGSLLHHSSSITTLYFPNRSKLLSSAEDSTIAVTRTRDWSLLSTIKAPIPKPQGRPSGDTAPPGGTPSGINDFAVHPSLKLMISVGKGERCMRLWNLVTGKKAGVLNFGRDLLGEAGEGKYASGEGRKVAWGSTEGGEEFCVGFERGVLVFGMNSKPKCKVIPDPKTKLHQLCYITTSDEEETSVMAVSTEDGRILFYSTSPDDLIKAAITEGKELPLPSGKLVAHVGGKEESISSRIKDFRVLRLDDEAQSLIIVAASSDGSIRLWKLSIAELKSTDMKKSRQVGSSIGVYETGNRITCVTAFVMLPQADGAEEESEVEIGDGDEVSSRSSSDSE